MVDKSIDLNIGIVIDNGTDGINVPAPLVSVHNFYYRIDVYPVLVYKNDILDKDDDEDVRVDEDSTINDDIDVYD